MSSIQERLQLKRIPLDTWNIREQLCLASAVVRSGDQNWMSVSRALKTVGEPNRPADWYSQKSCAAQYGALLENVETPKRKKRNSEGAVETPQESILKKLTQERIAEIQESVAEMNRQYDQIKNEINEVRNPATSEERVRELWAAIETAKRARERETAKRAAWLKEREERRARAERTWRPPQPNQSAPSTPPPPSSPLLTSLLKSSPVVTTPQLMSHPATVVETISPSAGAPTLSMLLEKPGSTSPHDNKHAAIEHIKSQLVQIEQQLKANTTVPSPVPLPAPAVDIDDIEIKAEDVYAFRDIDLHIPPVATMHKGTVRAVEKPPFKKDEEDVAMLSEIKQEVEPATVEVQPMEEEKVAEEIPVEEVTVTEEPAPEPVSVQEPEPKPEEVKIAFPEVKFPTPEIKVIQPEDQKPKEEVKEPEPPPPEPEVQPEEVVVDVPEVVEEVATELVEETIIPPEPSPPSELEEFQPLPPLPPLAPPPPPPPPPPQEPEPPVLEVTDLDSIPLPSDPPPADNLIEIPAQQPPLPPLPPEPPTPEETIENIAEEVNAEQEVKADEKDIKDEDAEDSIPLKDIIKEEPAEAKEAGEAKVADGEQLERADTHDDTPMEVRMDTIPLKDIKEAGEVKEADGQQLERADTDDDTPVEDTIPLKDIKEAAEAGEGKEADGQQLERADTDDDTPMEVRMLSREEEQDGKKKKDYSRKKKSDSRTCSGSESAEASAPDSPHATDAERQHRLWKRSVMLVYSRLCAHKYASLFLRPITDEEAPGYSVVIKRPMDLTSIKRNIEAGNIRTTAEFQRDILLMLSNALMYNSSEHSVYQMAKELHEEAVSQLGMLLAAQAHAGLAECAPRRKRRRADSPHQHKRAHH